MTINRLERFTHTASRPHQLQRDTANCKGALTRRRCAGFDNCKRRKRMSGVRRNPHIPGASRGRSNASSSRSADKKVDHQRQKKGGLYDARVKPWNYLMTLLAEPVSEGETCFNCWWIGYPRNPLPAAVCARSPYRRCDTLHPVFRRLISKPTAVVIALILPLSFIVRSIPLTGSKVVKFAPTTKGMIKLATL